MQHLVIEHVAQKPGRHERLIQRRIDPNDPVFLLDCAKDKIFPWPMLAPAAPHYVVTAKTSAKISFIQVVEHWAQIKMRLFMAQIQVPLHRQLWISELPFDLFLLVGHCDPFQKRESERLL